MGMEEDYSQEYSDRDQDRSVMVEFDDIVLDREDKNAILFRLGDREVWIPRSQILEVDYCLAEYGLIKVYIPEWLAIKEGLI
jgi:hypothetical protein